MPKDEALTLTVSPMLPMIGHNESYTYVESDNIFAEQRQNHTSLVGLDVIGPQILPTPEFSDQIWLTGGAFITFDTTTVNFTVSYFEFECPSVLEESTNGSWISLLGPDSLHANSSMLLKQADWGTGFFFDINSTSNSQAAGQNVVFGSFQNSQVTMWSCVLSMITRDVSLSCSETGEIYNSPIYCDLETMGTASVSTTTPFGNFSLATNIFGNWPLVDPASFGISSLTEQYLAQGPNFTASLVDLSKMDNSTFSGRLTTIFNTYIQTIQPSSQDAGFIALSIFNHSFVDTWLRDKYHEPLAFKPFALVTCNWIWFTLLTVASILLIFCASISAWFSHRLSTPDLMGYVSTMVLHNPYISDIGTLPSNSTLGGLERAKLLRTVKVQIRDVYYQEEIGKFALTNDIQSRSSISKGRKYV